MAVFRRRRGRPAEPVRATGYDLETVSELILGVAEAATGSRPSLVGEPEPLLAGAGPDAFSFTLDTEAPGWTGLLVARTSAKDVLRRETEWLQAAGALGFPVPHLVSDSPDDGVLVFTPPVGENLVSLMTTELMALPELLANFGRLHARLHALPADGLASLDGDDPIDELSDRATASSVRKAVDRELGWLRSQRPDGAASVLCHGELHPVHVYVERGDAPSEVAVNWTHARLAEPAFDVAATLAAFWTAPIYVANVAQRAMLKMARDSISSAYMKAYGEAASQPLDEAALRYWEAFHLCWLAIHIVDLAQGEPAGPWDPAANVAQPDKALQDVRNRFWELTGT